MVMLRSSSFLKRTVWTPEMARTVDDLPCATWPMVPMLIWKFRVSSAARDGERRRFSGSGGKRVTKSGLCAGDGWTGAGGAAAPLLLLTGAGCCTLFATENRAATFALRIPFFAAQKRESVLIDVQLCSWQPAGHSRWPAWR